jgi:hypothetical protein
MNTSNLHYNYTNTSIGNEYQFHKRYEDADSNIKYFNMLIGGKLKNDVQNVSMKWEKALHAPPTYFAEIAIEVGINRAHEAFERNGNLDFLFQKNV